MKRRAWFWMSAVVIGLAAAYFLTVGAPETAQAASLPGTASLSGTVDSPAPFQAAQVFIRNKEKRMLYMVYTSGGKYRAINLFPGEYEVSVRTWGYESDVQKVTLSAGQNGSANLAMKDTSKDPTRRGNLEYVSYDEAYPPGPGREIAERTCNVCHGQNFLLSKHLNETQWGVVVDMMRGKGAASGEVMILEKDMSDQDRGVLLKYLAANFGPDSKQRAVQVDKRLPVDEKVLSKAMYIEYYLQEDPPGQGVNDPQYKGVDAYGAGRRVGQDPRFDNDGNVWLIDRGTPNRIVRLDPRTGATKDYLMPRPTAGLHDIDFDRRSGLLWIPENEGIPASNMKLVAFNPKTEKWGEEYHLDPQDLLDVPLKHAQSLDIDSKGNIYVGMILGDGLSAWSRETKKVTTYPIPESITGGHGSLPYGVITDSKDNVWIALARRGKILKFDPKTTKFTEYIAPTNPSFIRRLNVDAKDNVWFPIFSSGELVKLDQKTGKMTPWKIPAQFSAPYDVQEFGGKIWIADAGQESTLIAFDPQTEKFTFYPSPQPNADKPKIQITREGAIWYSPRSSRDYPGFGVLFPDMDKMTTFAAEY